MSIEQSLTSLSQSLCGLVPRSHQDKVSFQILSLLNGLNGEGYSLESALDAYARITIIPSFRGEIIHNPPSSLGLYQSLGEWLRLRPNDCIDFHCREKDPVTERFPVTTNIRFETAEEALADKIAYESLVEMETDGRLIFNEAHSPYHSEERPDADLSETIKTAILLWPQMASLLFENVSELQSDGIETLRINISHDPENGSPSLHCYPTFDSDEKKQAFYDMQRSKVGPGREDFASTYIHGPSYLGEISFATTSGRVRYLRNGRLSLLNDESKTKT